MRALLLFFFYMMTILSYAQVTVIENQNVGVGKEIPVEKLDVDGTVLVSGKIGVGTLTPTEMLTIRQTNSMNAGLRLEALTDQNYYLLIQNNYDSQNRFFIQSGVSKVLGHTTLNSVSRNYFSSYDNLSFYTGNTNPLATNERMTILQNGFVGVNNPNPLFNLDIAGDLRVSGLFVDSQNSPGTVGQILQSTNFGTEWVDLDADHALVKEVNGAIRLHDDYNNTSLEGDARGEDAIEIITNRSSNDQVAARNSVAIGVRAKTLLGVGSPTLGGFGVAIGYESEAQKNSIAIGRNSKATAQSNSIAIGKDATATGDGGVALGSNSMVESLGGFAFGGISKGTYSVALGRATISYSMFETAIGSFNELGTISTNWNLSEKVFDIGNGENTNNLSSAFSVYKSGATKFHPVLDNSSTTIPNPQAGMIIFNEETTSFEGHDGIEWGPLCGSQKFKIEIPNTEFIDFSNPTIVEVRTWVDANLSDLEKNNSELFMIETLTDGVSVLGSTINEPDYVWHITNDNITEIHRRENHGSIWYINPAIPSNRAFYAQKGNPNRPLKSWDNMVDYANLQDGDVVHVMAGSQTITKSSTKGNVIYHFEGGAELISNGYMALIDIPDSSEKLHVTGNIVTNTGIVSKGVDGYVEGDEMYHVSFNGSGVFIAEIKRMTYLDGALNLRPLFGKSSKCAVNVGYYSGHNLMANGSGKSNSNWVVSCKKWVYSGEMGTVSQFYFGAENAINVNEYLIIDMLKWDGIEMGGSGFRGLLMNCTSTGSPTVTDCNFSIHIKELEVGSSSSADNYSLLSIYRLNMVNSKIKVKIDNAKFNCKLITAGSSLAMTDSNIDIEVSGITTTTNSPILDLSGPRINSTISFTGSMEHTVDVPFLTSTSTVDCIYFNDFDLVTDGNLGSVNSNIYLYNSKFIVNPIQELLTTTIPLNIINSGTLTNTLLLDPDFTEVGSTILKNANFK